MTAPARERMPHLFAVPIALALAAIILLAGQRVLIHLEHATIVSTAPESFALKNQGLAFQRAAAHSPKVLPIYGSSELFRPAAPARGNIFFRTAPTGFQLSPVGGGGANPLIMLQKVSALGSALRGKRVAFSLSPSWFCTAKPGTKGYKGNFSPMAATELVFGTALHFRLKRDIAARMSNFRRRWNRDHSLNSHYAVSPLDNCLIASSSARSGRREKFRPRCSSWKIIGQRCIT
jgi:D-alanine transfer protein